MKQDRQKIPTHMQLLDISQLMHTFSSLTWKGLLPYMYIQSLFACVIETDCETCHIIEEERENHWRNLIVVMATEMGGAI